MNNIKISNQEKVLIINPPRFNGMNVRRDERSADVLSGEVSPFYQGAVLAQFLRNKNKALVKVLDANGLDLNFSEVEGWLSENNDYEFVIIKAADDTIFHDAEVGRLAKKFGMTTLLWEPILSPAMPGRVLKELNVSENIIDYLILNEAELTASDFLKEGENAKGVAFLKDSKLVVNPRNDDFRIKDLNELPIPDFNDLPINKYLAWFKEGPWMTLFTSRGCVGTCSYCLIGGSNVSRGYGCQIRMHNYKRIFEEVEILVTCHGVKHITFWDDCFTLNRQRVVDFCNLVIIKKLKFKWSCMSRSDLIDEELVLLMKKAGLTRIGFGVESGSQKILDSIPKKITVEQNNQAIKMCKKQGLWVWIFIILGLPEEDWSSATDTIKFVKKTRPNFLFCGCATPFPGTRYYDQCLEFGLFNEDVFNVIARGELATGAKARARSKYLNEQELEEAEFLLHKAFLFSSLRNVVYKIIQNRKNLSPRYLKDKITYFFFK